jgi:NADPH:quinone reductase and related Zn-dependent oxidoreductases
MGGRLVMIGTMGSRKGDLDVGMLLAKRATIIGSTLRGRSAVEKADIVRRFLAQFGDRIEAGTVRPIIDRIFPLEQAAAAHRYVAASAHFGKVVLVV